MVHMSVGSPSGSCTVGNPAFYRYVLRLVDAELALDDVDRANLDVLAAIPHAFIDDDVASGSGWRIVPAASLEDWPVLEATPQRLRAAFQTARRLLWRNAAPVGISAGDIVDVDTDIDTVLGVLQRAEAAGCPVSVSYVS